MARCVSSCMALLLLSGCFTRTPKPVFYTLTPVAPPTAMEQNEDMLTLAVGPATLPLYLEARGRVSENDFTCTRGMNSSFGPRLNLDGVGSDFSVIAVPERHIVRHSKAPNTRGDKGVDT